MSNGEIVLLSLGANIGERELTLLGALEMIAAIPNVSLVRVSSLYATEPVGYRDQPEFVNCAALVESRLSPRDLLKRLREIERELGRVERLKWRQREIDIDIILHGDQVISTHDLTIPHPEMERRLFVLRPLAEIAPEAIHPVLGLTVGQLLERCPDDGAIRRVSFDGWPGTTAS